MLGHYDSDARIKRALEDNRFYREKTTIVIQRSEQDFVNHPGDFDINQVFKGKGNKIYYQPPSKETTAGREKKVVLVSDESLAYGITKQLIIIFEEIVKTGFELRYWNGTDAIVTADLGADRTHIRVSRENDVIECLARKNIGRDQICHLDYFAIRRLLVDYDLVGDEILKETTGNLLFTSDFYFFDVLPPALHAYLNAHTFKICLSYIHGSEKPLHKEYADTVRLLVDKFPENITGLILHNVDDMSLFQAVYQLKNLQDLVWQERKPDQVDEQREVKKRIDAWGKIKPKVLAKLTRCIIFNYTNESTIPREQVSQIINNSPVLEAFTFDIKSFTPRLERSRYTLKYLKLKGIEDIDLIRKSAETLKHLQLESGGKLTSSVLNNIASFPQLETLVLNFTKYDFILQLLSKTPNLQKLKVHFPQGKLPETIPILSLLKLKSISLAYTSEPGFSKYILENAPNLTDMNIDVTEADWSSSYCFDKIRTLRLTEVSRNFAANVIHGLTDVEAISIGFRNENENKIKEWMPNKIVTSDTPLYQLRTIDAMKTEPAIHLPLPLGTYLSLVAKAPLITAINLTKLRLLFDFDEQSLAEEYAFQLPQVEIIDLSESEITGRMLAKILRRTPNIRELILDKCLRIADLRPEHLPDFDFTRLTKLSCSYSTFPGNALAKLMAQSPNIVTCNLAECRNLSSFNIEQYPAKNREYRLSIYPENLYGLSLKTYLAFAARYRRISLFYLSHVNLNTVTSELEQLSPHDFRHIQGLFIENYPQLPRLFRQVIGKFSELSGIYGRYSQNAAQNVIDESHIPDEIILPNLRNLDLRYINMTGNAIIRLIQASSQIQSIVLDNNKSCQDLTIDLIKTVEGKLSHLDFFYASRSTIPLPAYLKLASLVTDWGHPATYPVITTKNAADFDGVPVLHIPYIKFENITGPVFSRFLQSVPTIKSIEVEGTDMSGDVNITMPLVQLETLKVTCKAFPCVAVDKVVAMAPNLRKINLQHDYIEDSPRALIFYPGLLSLRQLEEITCSGNTMSSSVLVDVIAGAEKLRRLDLNKSDGATGNNHFETTRFPHLNSLSLLSSSLPHHLLERLLVTTPNLETMKIRDCNFTGSDKLSLNVIPLRRLKTIEIWADFFNLDLLSSVLENSSNLEQFIYRNMRQDNEIKFIDIFKLVKPHSLEKLTRLKLHYVTLESQDYQRIVEMMPNISKIELHGCKLGKKQKLSSLPPNKLQEITIVDCEIDDQALTQVIRVSYSLREFTLILSNSRFITEALFISLVTCCPELSKLVLADIKFKNLTVSMLPRDRMLLNLRKVSFYEDELAKEIQEWLRKYAPNSSLQADKRPTRMAQYFSSLEKTNDEPENSRLKDNVNSEGLRILRGSDATTLPDYNSTAVVTQDGNPPGTILRAGKIFFPSDHPRLYRFEAYSALDLSGEDIKLVQTVNMKFTKPKKKIDYVRSSLWSLYLKKYHHPEKPSHRFCEPEVFKISDKPRPIPAHYPQEWIVAFYTDFKGKYTIEYVEEHDLYYIWATTPTPETFIHINYIVTIAKPSVLAIQPPELQRLIEHCHFHRGDLVIEGPSTAKKIVAARFNDRVGSCENRAIVFKDKLDELRQTNKKYASYRTRIMRNGIHAFIEMSDGGSWKLVELGGYDDELAITEMQFETLDNMPLANTASFAPLAKMADARSAAGRFLESARTYLSSERIEESDLDPALMPWKNKYQPLPTSAQGLQQALTVAGKNSLIMFNEPDHCLALMAHLATTGQPYLFIDTAGELQWKGAGLVFKNATEFALKKNISRLRYFAKNTPNGIIFINWSNMSVKDMAALHCVIDKVRLLESEELPRQLAIGSCCSDKTPEDFGSRQHTRYTWAPNNIDLYHGRRKETAVPDPAEVLVIDLYNVGHGWENLLFGFPHIAKKRFTMEYSDFLTACANNKDKPFKHLHIKNPPWHVREFQLFWQQALQQQSFVYGDKQFTWAPDFQLTYSSNHPLPLDAIDSAITNDAEYEFPFNMHTLSTYFEHYQFRKETFVKETGLLSRHRTLRVVATEEMQFDHWYRLLCEARQHGCTLHIYVAPGIVMPSEIPRKYYRIYNPEPAPFDINTMDINKISFALIETKQSIALIAAELKKKFPKAMSISLSLGHDFGDLFYQNHGHLVGEQNSEDMEIDAKFFESDPWKHLQRENNVVLIEGTLTQSMINALSPLLLHGKSELLENGKPVLFKGKLFVVTDSQVPFAKNRYVGEVIASPAAATKKESVAKPEEALVSASSSDFDLSLATCQRFKQQRFEKIMAGFKQSPIISCIGETGIGKTTYFLPPKHASHRGFEQDYFERTGRLAVMYVGESSIEDFAKHALNQKLGLKPANSDAFLFLDEAKLTRKQLSILKGLKHPQPHLLVNGHYYDYTSQNNQFVFLIDNPDDYGGARQQQEFLKECAVTVSMDQPNHAYLYHEIIKRLFDKYGPSLSDADSERIGRTLLTIYDTINAIAHTKEKKKFLSPRHLHMMTLLFNKYRRDFSTDEMDLTQLVITASLTIVGDGLLSNMEAELYTFLTKTYHYDQNSFHRFQNKYCTKYIADDISKPNKDFLFTNNHRHVLITLHTFLSMRDHEDFHFGLLLEGPSGIGKSEAIKHYLRQLNIPYSQFSLGKNYETDRALLTDSPKSKVKMIDEINVSVEEHEKSLNTLIMNGEFVVGTLNSIANAGRSVLPFALRSRFTLVKAVPYPASDMIDILRFKGLPKAEAQLWTGKFVKAVTYAQQRGLEEPNLRHVELAAGLIKPEQPVVAPAPAPVIPGISAAAVPAAAPAITAVADKTLDLDLNDLIMLIIKRILSNEKFWRDQVVVGVIADVPQGIDRMRFKCSDIAALRSIATECLDRPLYSVFTDMVKGNGNTDNFYRILLIEDPVILKSKLDEFEKLQNSKVVNLPVPRLS